MIELIGQLTYQAQDGGQVVLDKEQQLETGGHRQKEQEQADGPGSELGKDQTEGKQRAQADREGENLEEEREAPHCRT